jgi:putative serine protease PepD
MSDTEGTRPEQSDAEAAAAAPIPPTPSPAPEPAVDTAAARPPLPEISAAEAASATAPTVPVAPATGESFGPAATGPTAPLWGTPAAPAPKKKSGATRAVGLLVAAAIVGGAAGLGGAAAGMTLWSPKGTTSAATGPTTVTVNDTSSVNQTTAVAAKVVPSVVTISAESGQSAGTGSGVILTADGYVVTNTHVVTLDGATANATLKVTTSDGHIYDATVVGTDPTYDLAVIKLTGASGLTPITFGDSSKLNVGDQTIAVGAPLGLSNTVTNGIVSALNRSIEIASSAPSSSGSSGGDTQQGQQSPFQFDFGQGQTQTSTTSTIKISVIQTDAAINPGNSGGALVDSSGQLIGINVAIAGTGSSTSGTQSGNIGVGFSIPSDIVKRITDELIQNGKATHGLLGASVQDSANVTGATISGAYVADVTSGGPAAAAGLQKGDIITEFNGQPVTGAVDLTAEVRALAAGAKASLTYVRDGASHTVDVTLGSLS